MDFIINNVHDGLCVREYLNNVLGVSRSELTELKKKELGIVLNGVRVTVRAVLHSGDVLSLQREDNNDSQSINAVNIPLDILYEDDDIIALNKQYGMPTHPSHDHQHDTLANGLAFYYKDKGIPFVFRAVNRLDRDTSGIVLVAKNKSSAFILSKDMTEHRFEKKYIAITVGEADICGMICKDIRRIEESKIKREVCPSGIGQHALTEYETLEAQNGTSVLSVTPKTGRTHQIRVHLSSIGYPILGDTLYGEENGSSLINRQALHAYSLSFTHPTNKKIMRITAPLPDDMGNLLSTELREKLCKR